MVNANTYSSGDLFTAGFMDNRIGSWFASARQREQAGRTCGAQTNSGAAMKAAGQPMPALAHGANLTVAVRRAVRSGDADGVLIEDSGIAGQPYAMTQRDVFDSNADLIEHCGQLLTGQPWTQLDIARRGSRLTITTAGLDHVDIYADGHPAGPGVPARKVARKSGWIFRTELVGIRSGRLQPEHRFASGVVFPPL